MVTKFSLTAAAIATVAALGLSTTASAAPTDVLVQDGAGNVIATGVHTFDENEAGSGLALGFTPVIGSTFTFLYQANVVSFNDALGQAITPATGLNTSFASGGYEFTVVARITETVTGISAGGGAVTVTFAATGGTASIFFDNAASGGVKAVTNTGSGFDDGHLVGQFDVVAGTGLSNFTTFGGGAGLGATQYDFVISGSAVDANYISGLSGPIGDMHFTSSQVIPPGTSTTTGFHLGTPSGAPDIYPTTPTDGNLLLKVDGSNTFTAAAVPEPETYALMLAGLGAIGFMTRRRRKS
jgi:hypothetical protein